MPATSRPIRIAFLLQVVIASLVVVLCILVRLWTKPEAKTAAFALLTVSLVLTLAGNVLYDHAGLDSTTGLSVGYDVLLLAST